MEQMEFDYIDKLGMHGKPEDLINYSVEDNEFDETKPLGRFNKFR